MRGPVCWLADRGWTELQGDKEIDITAWEDVNEGVGATRSIRFMAALEVSSRQPLDEGPVHEASQSIGFKPCGALLGSCGVGGAGPACGAVECPGAEAAAAAGVRPARHDPRDVVQHGERACRRLLHVRGRQLTTLALQASAVDSESHALLAGRVWHRVEDRWVMRTVTDSEGRLSGVSMQTSYEVKFTKGTLFRMVIESRSKTDTLNFHQK